MLSLSAPPFRPSPRGEGSFTFLSAQKSEAKRRAKRYPYFPLPENMDAIAHHPTPAILPAEWKNIESPRPSRGGGVTKCTFLLYFRRGWGVSK